MSRQAIYAGSFDPWSLGHAFVLECALEIFDTVHICVAVNPSKTGILSPARRSLLIAKSLAPFHYFAEDHSTFSISSRVTVSYTFGLVSDFAKQRGVSTLLRGLRSTSDFEAEFNLYFSNYAISPDIKTWTVLCPPELLHCSSTYVRTVVGHTSVDTVGTGFLAQCLLLERPTLIGEVFDLLQSLDNGTKDNDSVSLHRATRPSGRALQKAFSAILNATTDEDMCGLQAPWLPVLRDTSRQCHDQFPDPFALEHVHRDTIFQMFRPAISGFLRPLIKRSLPSSTKDLLQGIIESENPKDCSRRLTQLWHTAQT